MSEVSEQFDITAVPSFIVVKEGEVMGRINGANAPELTKLVEKYSRQAPFASSHVAPVSYQPPKEDLKTRLKKLTTMAPVMLFMKGSPSEPKCGFSRTIVGLLDEQGTEYKSFDILTDEEVRQGLKEYANWPTFPQLWIDGELVGGLDIVKELIESGEFQSMLPAQNPAQSLNDRLAALINKAPLMIFIKGSPDQPKCGFSRQLISLLDDLDARYDFFDILTDEEVRQGLKDYSDWPTYPQVYVRGELVGGLDIVKEMISSGEFLQTLQE